ncbi:sensor histidine kinase [Ekhidna sp.]|uniref:sensor histidine kinase n=1 Tax=Ekhidna sp. TaxID=2608089 RepID=UPI003CCBEA2C
MQYVTQALLALVIMLILRKFYRQYQNDFYLLWSWSWLALFVNMFGSCISLANAFLLPLDHPFRIIISIITVTASLLQILWLYSGTLEISRNRKLNRKVVKAISYSILPFAILLVFLSFNDPDAGTYRILYRVGIKSLFAGIVFTACAFMLLRMTSTGIGIRFIIFSFLSYGLLQGNYFLETFLEVYQVDYPLEVPYFAGAIDIFLQALMGLGMIISVLEVEQHNLKKANSELDTFLYRSSHDLRAPLTTISGIISIIRSIDDPDKKEEYFNAIQDRLIQADNVIRDIITLRKGQKTELQIDEVDLEKEVKKEFESLIDPNNGSPKLSIEADEKTHIHTDAARLHTILTNLLSNAIKYHHEPAKAKISVSIHGTEKGFNVVLSDNGPGIDEKHLPKIFDMFYRAHRSSSGTGLGLYLVKDALEHMGGTIEVASEKGKGTTFRMHLIDHTANHS